RIWQSAVGASGIPQVVLQPLNQWLLAQSGTAGDYLRAVSQMQAIARRIVAFFDNVDVLITPTYMHSSITIGAWANLNPETTLQQMINWIAPCPPFNASGQPAIALPTGFDDNGLPIGIQLVGRPATESTLIALAAQLEAAQSWSQYRPAIAV
ncbi:amidase family protein, partial [Gloeocapsopsis crepidinum]|uniref:amidase family protein n=1 Tax=Gloeocapsopsis crepidinum TaxID=693223 RepID=UPI003F6FE55C